jgi:hypothetical protein
VFPPHLVANYDEKKRKQYNEKFEFLAVCVTGWGMAKEKVLGDVPISRGTGKNMAVASMDLFKQWGIANNIIGLGHDTTSSNTGAWTGKIIVTKDFGNTFIFKIANNL